jgi:hypothetical protein
MRLSQVGNKVQREIFTSKGEGVIELWRKLCTKELHNLCYYWDDQIKEDGMDETCGDEKKI